MRSLAGQNSNPPDCGEIEISEQSTIARLVNIKHGNQDQRAAFGYT
jgi:hypothetical protein